MFRVQLEDKWVMVTAGCIDFEGLLHGRGRIANWNLLIGWVGLISWVLVISFWKGWLVSTYITGRVHCFSG